MQQQLQSMTDDDERETSTSINFGFETLRMAWGGSLHEQNNNFSHQCKVYVRGVAQLYSLVQLSVATKRSCGMRVHTGYEES